MYKILTKRELNDTVTMMEVEAPLIAAKAKAGQFIIFRVDEYGERIPLTVAGTDMERGAVMIIFQKVGKGTQRLGALEVGDAILDFVGPLGRPSALEGYEHACVVGGGVGCAIAYPSAKELHAQGTEVTVIAGFRSKDIVILEDEFRTIADELHITTDDGSYGTKGFVTDKLKELITQRETEGRPPFDLVVAIGPVVMMKFVAKLTAEYGIKTLVSLNPIMVDGTGMCGGCRVTVNNEIKFACVDGPEFDGHQVDFDELILRNNMYRDQESKGKPHYCRIGLTTAKDEEE
ncbi:MAG: sulfide/dihydroorotate dehydrogenase-like FAD/NAD-binding protein [Clostridiaceae bacterium]|nr:sulfide/dihydroorotate dehydrogenase-like FAD/NAD-binding protein [Clostridiaceae bacterium]